MNSPARFYIHREEEESYLPCPLAINSFPYPPQLSALKRRARSVVKTRQILRRLGKGCSTRGVNGQVTLKKRNSPFNQSINQSINRSTHSFHPFYSTYLLSRLDRHLTHDLYIINVYICTRPSRPCMHACRCAVIRCATAVK